MSAYPNLSGVFNKPVVTTRGRNPSAGQTDGSFTVQNNTVAFSLPFDAENLVLVYGNLNGGVSDVAGANPITVRAGFEDDEGGITPLSPGGVRDVVIAPGDYAAIPIEGVGVYPAGTPFYVRTRVVVETGGKFGCNLFAANGVDGFENGSDDSVDLTTGGAISAGPNGGIMFAPICILGDTVGGQRVAVAIVGDSNSAGGAGGLANIMVAGVPSTVEGYAGRAIGGIFPTVNMGQNGESVGGATLEPYREQVLASISHALVMYGTNNVFLIGQSLETVKANLLAFWQRLKDELGIAKVFAVTIPPQTTSTDNWITEENQTAKGETAIRNDLNDWLLTLTPENSPVDRVFDAAPTVEAAGNRGIWKVLQPETPVTNVTNPFVSCTGFNLTVGGTLPTDGSLDGWDVTVIAGTGAGSSINIAFIAGNTFNGNNAFAVNPDGTSTFRVQKRTTFDGVHMNPDGQDAYATAVDPDAFTLPAPSGNAMASFFW